jgi:hypothetical protein
MNEENTAEKEYSKFLWLNRQIIVPSYFHKTEEELKELVKIVIKKLTRELSNVSFHVNIHNGKKCDNPSTSVNADANQVTYAF